MSETLSVFNSPKLIEVKLEHPLNNELKLFNDSDVTLEKSIVDICVGS